MMRPVLSTLFVLLFGGVSVFAQGTSAPDSVSRVPGDTKMEIASNKAQLKSRSNEWNNHCVYYGLPQYQDQSKLFMHCVCAGDKRSIAYQKVDCDGQAAAGSAKGTREALDDCKKAAQDKFRKNVDKRCGGCRDDPEVRIIVGIKKRPETGSYDEKRRK